MNSKFSWKESRTDYGVFCDHIYEEYKMEKHRYQEKDVLSKKEYFLKYRRFLLNKWERRKENDKNNN